jgi:UDP:flavonoid glycosyltransferase YjiC (YdhE family)
MACIVFLTDKKENDLLSSFGLASALKRAGYDVTYINTAGNEEMIRGQGFDLLSISGDDGDLIFYLMEGGLDIFLKEKKPDLFIVSGYLVLEALILHYKYDVLPVILTNYLRDPDRSLVDSFVLSAMTMPGDILGGVFEFIQSLDIRFGSLSELAKPLAEFYELVLCPSELEMGKLPENGRIYHAGPSIRPECDANVPADLSRIKKDKKIIYASLESFYQGMVNVMRHPDLSNTCLVMYVRREFDVNELGVVPENVYITHWVPPVNIIKNASLVISHGELDTIKESIWYGVPAIVFPLLNRQCRHAVLVEYHRLGISEQMELITEDRLRSGILYTLHNNAFRDNIQRMSTIFHERASSQDVAALINEFINVPV